jgi:peptidoglycan/LPS O-acetylase OafA/YrhL
LREGAVAILAWAVLLAALAAMLWIWTEDAIPIAMLGGAAVATAALGLVAALRRRRREGLRAVPDLSLATALVGVALAAMLAGAEAGLWLVYVGGGLLALGAGGVARELLAARRAARRSRCPPRAPAARERTAGGEP